jgi:anti-sigma factor RsiW
MSAYLDLELPAGARGRLERHTAQCPECRGVLEDLARMLELLRSSVAPEPVAGVSAIAGAVMRRLHEPAER